MTRGTRTTREGVFIPSSCSLTGNSSQSFQRTGRKYPSSEKSIAVATSVLIMTSAFWTVMTLIGCQDRLSTNTCLSRLLMKIRLFFLACKFVLPVGTAPTFGPEIKLVEGKNWSLASTAYTPLFPTNPRPFLQSGLPAATRIARAPEKQ
jgi:hypothetical protein